MNTTQLLATWGAVSGSAALAWDIYKWSHRGARITVEVVPDMLQIRPGEQRDSEKFVVLTVCNTGDRPTTITNMAGFWYRSWWQKIRKRPAVKFIVPLPGVGDQQVPYLLNPGARWMGMACQDQDVESYLSAGRLEMGVFFSGSKRGSFRPVVRLKAIVDSSDE